MAFVLDSLANNLSYNVKLSKMIGVLSSIYISATCLFLNKDNRNSEDAEFTINRNYITNISGLTKEEQLEAEKILSHLKLIKISKEFQLDKLKLDPQAIVDLIKETDLNKIEEIRKSVLDLKPTTNPIDAKENKRKAVFENLKKLINVQDENLSKAYKSWIDGVYGNPNGFLSAASIEIFQNTINKYSKGDLNTALAIIEIATVGGYRDASWAINEYEKRKPKFIPQQAQPLRPVFNNEEQF